MIYRDLILKLTAIILLVTVAAFFKNRADPVKGGLKNALPIKAIVEDLAHDGYETMAGPCKDCHDMAAVLKSYLRSYPKTTLQSANLFCVTCHIPELPRPSPMIVFKLNKGSARRLSRLGSMSTGSKDEGPQQQPSTRLMLNNLGSGISVYQESSENPSPSSHRRLLCLNCHTAHNYTVMRTRTDPGNNPGNMVLKARPSRQVDLGQIPAALKTDNWALQGASWCLSCHPKDSSATGRNHPDYLCLYCHEDVGANSPLASLQFPHTGDQPYFLTEEPGTLCLSCHARGSLP